MKGKDKRMKIISYIFVWIHSSPSGTKCTLLSIQKELIKLGPAVSKEYDLKHRDKCQEGDFYILD